MLWGSNGPSNRLQDVRTVDLLNESSSLIVIGLTVAAIIDLSFTPNFLDLGSPR
jgi:hypothetical protein